MKHEKYLGEVRYLYNALYVKPLTMHIPIRSLPIRTDYDLTTVYGSTLHYFAKSVVINKENTMSGKAHKTTQNSALQAGQPHKKSI